MCSCLFAGDRRRTSLLRELHRDLGSRVPHADEKGWTIGELRGIPVLVRVHLHDRRVEIGSERRHLRLLEVRHRHDDVVGLERAVAGSHHEAIAATSEAVDPRVRANWQAEVFGVGLEVVRHRVLRHEVAPGGRESQSREREVASGGEQHERIPAGAPRIAHTRVGVEDHERASTLCEGVSHRQAGLPSADHDGVEGLCSVCVGRCLCRHGSTVRRTRPRRTSGELPKPGRSRDGYFCTGATSGRAGRRIPSPPSATRR